MLLLEIIRLYHEQHPQSRESHCFNIFPHYKVYSTRVRRRRMKLLTAIEESLIVKLIIVLTCTCVYRSTGATSECHFNMTDLYASLYIRKHFLSDLLMEMYKQMHVATQLVQTLIYTKRLCELYSKQTLPIAQGGVRSRFYKACGTKYF